jgi:hypothetical protein
MAMSDLEHVTPLWNPMLWFSKHQNWLFAFSSSLNALAAAFAIHFSIHEHHYLLLAPIQGAAKDESKQFE